MMLLWLMLWPCLVGGLASGRCAGSIQQLFGQKPMPTLPLGMRVRVLVEVTAMLVVVLATRFVAVFSLLDWYVEPPAESSFWLQFTADSILGAVMTLPILLAWASPAENQAIYWLKPAAFVGLIYAAVGLGLLVTRTGCVVVGILLSVLALSVVGFSFGTPRLQVRPSGRPETRWRPALDPEVQLRRDQWMQPLVRFWYVLVAALIVAIAAVLLNHWFELPRPTFYICMVFASCLLLGCLALRPIGSVLVVAGHTGAPGHRPGEFAAAWSVLPVPREAVLRGVYLHGLITGAAIWVMVLAANHWSSWLATGELSLVDYRGRPVGWLLYSAFAIVPCLAGFLTAGAVADRVCFFVSFGAMVAFLPLREVAHTTQVSPSMTACLLLGLALVGGAPPLRHLRKPRALGYEIPMPGKPP
jgi:hypothetical protein